ncbi:hypothetical protein CW751_05850 [Brumimicrobium salinarum]|uniref:Lipocalin-like domain-containing protein n=1 Tax=Brumimicrobium salinarum TaxID=2058658 RepID=A0A2I0R3E6_9FLAO|nr:hypothetical protein [Brumimicrobium salinarum]PKR81106.1 hypothetical protein CW751_05850 [Brumimicrobium salinarum]
MKNTMKFLTLALGLLFVLGSCNKYEEGPKFSLLTKKMRITGTWVPDKIVTSEGVETNAEAGDGEIVIDKSGSITLKTEGFGINGDWEFTNDKENIKMTFSFFGEKTVQEYQILRLKNKELWLKDEDNTVTQYVAK